MARSPTTPPPDRRDPRHDLLGSAPVARSPTTPPPDRRDPRHDLLGVFETQFDYVYRTLRRYGLSAVDAEDLSQEVFLVLWRRRASYDPSRPLRPWIAGIAYRIVQEHRRLRAREVLADDLDRPDHRPGPDDQLASAHVRRLVLHSLASVPPKQRVVVVMHDLDGMAMRDVAGALSLPLFTIYSQLRAGRRAFARAVRRAQLRASWADLRRADPQALLAQERPLPPAPPEARERAMQRWKGIAWAPAAPLAPPTVRDGLASPRGACPPVPRIAGEGQGSGPVSPPRAMPRLKIGWLGGAVAVAVALLALVLQGGPRPTRAGAPAVLLAAARASAAESVARNPLRSRAVPRIAVAARPPAAAPGPASLLRALAGYWRFDEGQGLLAHDLSGAGSDCQLQRLDGDAAWSDGALAGALSLDGRGWLECRPSDRLARIDRELTIAAWVTRGRATRNYHVLLARQHDTGRLNELYFGFANGDLAFVSHPLGLKVVKPLPAELAHWFHVAVTRQADGTAILYVDGLEIGRGAGPPLPLVGGNNPLLIGADVNSRNRQRAEARFDGAIDELLLYHRALSPAEVKVLATRRQPPVPPVLRDQSPPPPPGLPVSAVAAAPAEP